MNLSHRIAVVIVVFICEIASYSRANASTTGDYDGDGKADYAVWRPSNGTWYVIPSKTPNNFLIQQWGVSTDIPVRGDFDGDGKTDFAVWRPSNGTFYVIPSSNPSNFIVQQWGARGDIPVPGDYDGDGKTDFAVFRPSNGTWYIIPSSNPSAVIVQQWGVSGDIPVPGDYDGDGKTDFAVWRPSNGTFYVIPSKTPSNFLVQQWGVNNDMPVPGDYDGDGKTDFAVWRPSNGTFYVIPSSTPSNFLVQQWGTSTDIPVPADYDGDRKTDFAVWRPSNGTWYVIPSSAPANFAVTQWGINTDLPAQAPPWIFLTTPAGQWTWESGSNTGDVLGHKGICGTKGTPAAGNVPGSREFAVSWTDGSGNLWLFGGSGNDCFVGATGLLDDLWKYNPTTGFWTWESGSIFASSGGVYGTKGTPSANNVPGGRENSVSWIDNSGNLWLFGGLGKDSRGSAVSNDLNDLWKYDPTTGMWTWESGSSTSGDCGSYGTKGTPSPNNAPAARDSAVSWTDSSGNLWLFGGNSLGNCYSSTGGISLNELWEYNTTTGEWTWVNGPNTANGVGVYGTKGVPDSANVPGARISAVSWTEGGNLWLFGGSGDTGGYMNDLWQYSPSTGKWTWVSGSNMGYQLGTYGTQGTPDPANVPGARHSSVSWTDHSGDLWLFGGCGEAATMATTQCDLNDLWQYNTTSGLWTWMSGQNTHNSSGIYGTLGTASPNNVPGARESSVSWIDSAGNLWLFGGFGLDVNGHFGDLNDLWKFK